MSNIDLRFLKSSGVDIGDYALFIDGEPVVRAGSRVSISITSDYQSNLFVYKAVQGGSPVRDFDEKLNSHVEKLMDNTIMFGMDFKGWFSPSLLETTRSKRIKTNPSMKIMFYETLPYYILKQRFTVPSRKGTIIDGGDGKTLDTFQLNAILNNFRARGFQTYENLFEARMMYRAADFRGLATITKMYTLAFVHVEGLYNPLMDDPDIKDDFMKTPLGSSIFDRIVTTNRNTSYAFLSHYEISRLINIGGNSPRLLHFRYQILMRLLAAKYVSGLSPVWYPYKGQRLYYRREDLTGVPGPILTEQQYIEDVPPEYKEVPGEYFSAFDSFNFFWLSQRSYFRRFNMKDREVSDNLLIEMVADLII